ncbi:MAG: PaaI family thioesterase [Pedosphaera sp.]|nr:PaaI family thioesterase [Pedosphaera sp.]
MRSADGSMVRTRFTPSEAVVGFKGVVHGGILSTILDEVMVWACGVQTKRFAYCAELNVRFHSPARPGAELLATGKLVENRRNKIFNASGEIRSADDQLLAAATGKYIPIPESDEASLLAELEEGGSELFQRILRELPVQPQ